MPPCFAWLTVALSSLTWSARERGQVPRMNRLLALLSAQDGERSLSLTVALRGVARRGARRGLAD